MFRPLLRPKNQEDEAWMESKRVIDTAMRVNTL